MFSADYESSILKHQRLVSEKQKRRSLKEEIFNPFVEMLTTTFHSLHDNMSMNLKASSWSLAVFFIESESLIVSCYMIYIYMEMLFFVAEGSAAHSVPA